MPKTPEISWNVSALYKTAILTELSRHKLLCWVSMAVQVGCQGWGDVSNFSKISHCAAKADRVKLCFCLHCSLDMCTHNIIQIVSSVWVSGNLKKCHRQTCLFQGTSVKITGRWFFWECSKIQCRIMLLKVLWGVIFKSYWIAWSFLQWLEEVAEISIQDGPRWHFLNQG